MKFIEIHWNYRSCGVVALSQHEKPQVSVQRIVVLLACLNVSPLHSVHKPGPVKYVPSNQFKKKKKNNPDKLPVNANTSASATIFGIGIASFSSPGRATAAGEDVVGGAGLSRRAAATSGFKNQQIGAMMSVHSWQFRRTFHLPAICGRWGFSEHSELYIYIYSHYAVEIQDLTFKQQLQQMIRKFQLMP